MEPESHHPQLDTVSTELKALLDLHRDKRVIVLGTTCAGKSTLLRNIRDVRDQDKEIFPQLSPQEADYVCQTPWTEEIGRAMMQFVRERVKSRAGSPIFGTVVIDCDLIVLLTISEELLEARTRQRNVAFLDAKNMQEQIRREVIASGVKWVEFRVG